MHWIVQENIYSEAGFDGLIAALGRLDLPYSVHKVVPFTREIRPEAAPPAGPVVVMGSYSLARIAIERGWKPGTFANENHDFLVQRAHWGDLMLNADAEVAALSDVQPGPRRESFFIRPVTDSKSFSGRLMDWRQFEKWRAREIEVGSQGIETQSFFSLKAGDACIRPSTPVMICSPKRIEMEARLWIVRGRVVTASVYRRGAWKHYEPLVDPAMVAHAEEIAAAWSPADAFCLDMADTPDGRRIVEVSNLNAAGFYAADMFKLVVALEEAFGESRPGARVEEAGL